MAEVYAIPGVSSHNLSYRFIQSLSDLTERQTGEQGAQRERQTEGNRWHRETDRQRKETAQRDRQTEGAGSTETDRGEKAAQRDR